IFREVPFDAAWDELSFGGIDPQGAAEMFRKLEFKSLLERLDLSGIGTEAGGAAGEAQSLSVTRIDEGSMAELIDALPAVQAIHVEAIGENPHEAELLGISFY